MNITFFLFNSIAGDTFKTLQSIKMQGQVTSQVVVFEPRSLDPAQKISPTDSVIVEEVDSTSFDSEVLERINTYNADINIIYTKTSPLSIGYRGLNRLVDICSRQPDSMAYANYYETKQGVTHTHPLIQAQEGSVRNDFEYGSLQVYGGSLKVYGKYKYAALYADQLRRHRILVPEYLYTEQESDVRLSGEKQFDYVNPAQREVQIEMEQAFTNYLQSEGLLITPRMVHDANLSISYETEASVIIPVRNREKTISDAIMSALSQKAPFKFNVIVVDNHSTDNTTSIVAAIAHDDPRVVHLVPQQTDLGIGGCWDLAIRSQHCGKFAIQLDSDDLYSSPYVLQQIVNKFYQTKAAMVIGSYSLVDFNLNPLPPGLIDHTEWTNHNGRNNALRINGLGAPRAFFVPVLRKIGFPNTSYGEDYAVGLAISRQYRIGRIYNNLYLCRRWNGNSDAALSIEKQNLNNQYKDWIRTQEIVARRNFLNGNFTNTQKLANDLFEEQMEAWPEVAERFAALDTKVVRSSFKTATGITLEAQFNPDRIRSTAAKVDKESIAHRQCFLCIDNQPEVQRHLMVGRGLQCCVNPFPIMHKHFTIPSLNHEPQVMAGHYDMLCQIVKALPEMVVFYNGAQCGASAPDHFHFQATNLGEIPLQRDIDIYLKDSIKIRNGISLVTSFVYPFFFTSRNNMKIIIDALPMVEGEAEPRFNLIAWDKGCIIIPRRKLRPDCYYAEGNDNMCISPGAVDMGGLIIAPQRKDFDRLNADNISDILKEVTLTVDELSSTIENIKHNRLRPRRRHKNTSSK